MPTFEVKLLRVTGERTVRIEAASLDAACAQAVVSPGEWREPYHKCLAVVNDEVVTGTDSLANGF